MAIPSSGYSTADFSNPDSDLTDFVAVVDLSDMPADFWTAVSSSDGARGRVSKDDGTTELASEWVEFDDVAETGFVWFKWSGTLPSTGTSTVRIYPPQSGNSSYAVTNTFGRNNVWTDYEGVYHLNDTTDATGNGNDLTATGTISQVAGQIGDASDYENTVGSAPSEYHDTGILPDGMAYMSAWINIDNNTGGWQLMGSGGSTGDKLFYIAPVNGAGGFSFGYYDTQHQNNGISTTAGQWSRFTGSWDSGATNAFAYIDGVQRISAANSGGITGSSLSIWIAAHNDAFDAPIEGLIDEVRIGTNHLPLDHDNHEYDNQNDPTTFWGTWTWNAASGGTTLTAEQGTYTLTGQAANLLENFVIAANQGSYTLTGQDATLTKAFILTAEQGTYTTSTSTATLLQDEILTASQGSYTLSGQDATFLNGYAIIAGQGLYTTTGQQATLLIDKILTAGQGTYTLSGQDAQLLQGIILQASQGAYTLIGQDATLLKSTTGDATQLSITVKEIYQIDTTAGKQYKIELEANNLYNIILTAQEKIG